MKSLPDPTPPIQFPFETEALASDWPPAGSWVDRPIPFRLTDSDDGDDASDDIPDDLPTDADRAWHAAQGSEGGWVEGEPEPSDPAYWTEEATDYYARLAGESEDGR